MIIQQYLETQKELMIETFEEEYGFDMANTLQSLLDELQEYDLSEDLDLYDILDTHSCWKFDWEESVDEWFANDILDGRLEMFTDYMEYNLDEHGFHGVASLFDTTRKEIRYQVLRDHDANILDYMKVLHLLNLGYMEVDDDFFNNMFEYASDELLDMEDINIHDIFIGALEEYGWIESSDNDNLKIVPIDSTDDFAEAD